MRKVVRVRNRVKGDVYGKRGKGLEAYESGAKTQDQFLIQARKKLYEGRLIEIDRDFEHFLRRNYKALLAMKDQLTEGQREALERYMKNDETRRYERFLKVVEGK